MLEYILVNGPSRTVQIFLLCQENIYGELCWLDSWLLACTLLYYYGFGS